MSSSPDRARVRGRSPAFNALAATFENANARNMSTPPPVVRKVYPKSVTPDSGKSGPRSSSIAALSSSFEKMPPARQFVLPRSNKGMFYRVFKNECCFLCLEMFVEMFFPLH